MCDNIFESGRGKGQWGVPAGSHEIMACYYLAGLSFLKAGTKRVKNVLEVFGLEVAKRRTRDYIRDRE